MKNKIIKKLVLFIIAGLYLNYMSLDAECLQCNPSWKNIVNACVEIPQILFRGYFNPPSLYVFDGDVVNLKNIILSFTMTPDERDTICPSLWPENNVHRLNNDNTHNYYRRIKKHHKDLFLLIYGKNGIIELFKQKKDVKELQNNIITELDSILSKIEEVNATLCVKK